MAASSGNDGLVYSTGSGRMCPGCNNPIDQCSCIDDGEIYQGDGIVRVSRETKGRRGKAVTIIEGAPLDKSGLKKLGKELKQKCSSGGTVKDSRIEIQGDHRDKLIELLKSKGWPVKAKGG
jgi:translation initiation factor 1